MFSTDVKNAWSYASDFSIQIEDVAVQPRDFLENT